jgi:hypothetical protein
MQLIFLLRDATSYNHFAKHQTRQLLILHEVRCICNELKLPLNTELETTVTFVNRDGKTGIM